MKGRVRARVGVKGRARVRVKVRVKGRVRVKVMRRVAHPYRNFWSESAWQGVGEGERAHRMEGQGVTVEASVVVHVGA